MLRIAIKTVHAVTIILIFLAIGAWLQRFAASDPDRLRARLNRHASRWSRRLLGALGISVKQLAPFPHPTEPCLIVSNHVSYVDALVLIAAHPAVFVTSVEVSQQFFLGSMARAAGCLFVERRQRNGVREQIGELARVLKAGMPVVVFPEGTTSNGESVLAFKASLLAAAGMAEVPVQPVCLRYPWLDGRRLEGAERDVVCYYGDMEFFPHFKRLLAVHALVAEIEPLERLPKEATRKQIAEAAHAAILAAYDRVSPAPRARGLFARLSALLGGVKTEAC